MQGGSKRGGMKCQSKVGKLPKRYGAPPASDRGESGGGLDILTESILQCITGFSFNRSLSLLS